MASRIHHRSGGEKGPSTTRARCSSAGRDEKSELTARYWAYLFENLERSITEIYNTCEKQENVLQCKEVLLILENYTRDFGNLIEWVEIKWKYEHTPQPLRPQALAWEIRKPSFSALPHTRAYEQLVGISASPPNNSVKDSHASSASNHEKQADLLTNFARPEDKIEVDKIPLPALVQEISETCEIGLQTDLEGDPDIYYFAGGRHVASQTDYDEEFGPLVPQDTSLPVVLVPMEESLTSSVELNVLDQEEVKKETKLMDTCITLNSEAEEMTSPAQTAPITTNSESNVSTSQNLEPECGSQNLEMKSSFTQLSVGVLTEADGNVKSENDCPKSTQEVASEDKVAISSNCSNKCTSKDSEAKTSTTFADKARTAISKFTHNSTTNTAQSTAKGVVAPSASVLRPTLASKGKVKPVPRSNIASRFRTAVNSNRPAAPGSGVASHQPALPLHQIKQDISPSTSSKSVLNARPVTATATTSSRFYTKDFNNAPIKLIPSSVRPGVSRSKSMINPESLSKMKGKIGSATNISAGKKTQNSNSSQSFMSLPDATERGKGHVDEDGWETVRSRSNRSSKRSPSSSSLHSSTATLSRNSLEIERSPIIDKAGGGDEDVIGSSVDYEEIKKKEAALDSAVREEELLEEELLQIEKDFEEIENRARRSGNGSEATETSEAENITSSPEVFLDEIDNENRKPLNNKNEDNKTNTSVCSVPLSEGNVNFAKNVKVKNEDLFISTDINETGPRAEEFAPREPGRIVTLRQKLMSPAKRYDSAETLKRHQAKLEKAERNREKLLQAKYNRYVELSDRFEALNQTTKRLMEERAILVNRAQERRKRAEEKRQEYIRGIKRKAHDEDSKAREIAFINSLEAQNKRHDYMLSAQGVEERLQGRDEERKQKLEERGIKVSAVIQRQLRIRSNWEIKLKILDEKRRLADERISREKQEKAKERTELAMEKARVMEGRISALNAAKEAEKEVLQKKIQQKQEDTARRHEENMEHIRQKAVELSVPRSTDENVVSSSVRMCTLCNVTMHSEVQELAHIRAKSHLDAVRNSEKSNTSASLSSLENFGFKFIVDVQLDKVKPGVSHDKGRLKVMKKHCKKLHQNLMITGQDYEEKMKTAESIKSKELNPNSKIQKSFREINRLIALFSSGKGTLHAAHALDRLFGEARKLAVTSPSIQNSLVGLGVFSIAQKILECNATDLPPKVVIAANNFIIGATFQNLPNTIYVLRSSCICSILELVSRRWNALVPDDNRWLCGSPMGTNEQLPVDPVMESAVELLFNILNIVPDPLTGLTSPKGKYLTDAEKKLIESRTLDIIGYLVASGVIDRFTVYCSGVCGSADNQPQVASLLQISLDFIIMLIYALKSCWDPNKPETTMFLAALESSELAGTLSMSYALLFHQGAPTRPREGPLEIGDSENHTSSSPAALAIIPPAPGPLTVTIVKCALCLINAVASLDIHLLQNVLGSEAVSLQFRHIASQLLWQVVPHRTEDTVLGRLVKELLIAIGNFTVCNKLNQTTIQSGQTPTVLQQLCSLSYEYSSDPKLSSHYLPTIIAASYGCEENEAILMQHDIKREELEGFMKTEYAKVNAITKRLLQPDGTFSYALKETAAINQTQPLKSISGGGGKKIKNKKSQAKA